jgi:5-methylthioribose kinase
MSSTNSNNSYIQLDSTSVVEFIRNRWSSSESCPSIASQLFGSDFKQSPTVVEIGDGNLNFVYLLSASENNTAIIVKQAVPFVRVAPTWPLTATRAHFEAAWMKQQAIHKQTIDAIPKLLDYDKEMCLIIMEYVFVMFEKSFGFLQTNLCLYYT